MTSAGSGLIPEPWLVVSVELREALEKQLAAEICDGHPLAAETISATAACGGCDLAVLTSGQGRDLVWVMVRMGDGISVVGRFETFAAVRRAMTAHVH